MHIHVPFATTSRLLATAALMAATMAVSTAGGAVPASACAGPARTAAASTSALDKPISADAPYDTPRKNAFWAKYPKIAPKAGTDYGHLPRWKQYSNGRALVREDRVDLRRLSTNSYYGYTNVNPALRSYWLDKDAVILVSGTNYLRITGHEPAVFKKLYQVSRQRFLDSFNTGGVEWKRYVRYTVVYKLTFDRTHTHLRRIEQMQAYNVAGC